MSNTAGDADRFATAHAALKADPKVQFDLSQAPPPPQTPGWLKATFDWLGHVLEPVGRFLAWLASYLPDAPIARFLLWTVIALAVAALLWGIFQRLKTGEWRLPNFRQKVLPAADMEEEWAPDHNPARSWLQEADALAAEGRFAEAAHHLLFRSIEDISNRRPNLVRPALTSREIASANAIPNQARSIFLGLVGLVERSLFGGRPVGELDWTSVRAAYADFILQQAWRA
jgi:hypothetical protein